MPGRKLSELPTYRIVRRYSRDSDTAKVKAYYVIQKLSVNWFKSILFGKWYEYKDYYETRYAYMGSYDWHYEFSNLEKAKEFLKNLQEPVYSDEPVID